MKNIQCFVRPDELILHKKIGAIRISTIKHSSTGCLQRGSITTSSFTQVRSIGVSVVVFSISRAGSYTPKYLLNTSAHKRRCYKINNLAAVLDGKER